MFSFIIFILAALLILIFVILTMGMYAFSKVVGGISNLFYILTGKRKPKNAGNNAYRKTYSSSNSSSYSTSNSSSQSNNANNHSSSHHQHGEKVFNDDEGEYVDFVEIKN